jgi:hypothetical protein
MGKYAIKLVSCFQMDQTEQGRQGRKMHMTHRWMEPRKGFGFRVAVPFFRRTA